MWVSVISLSVLGTLANGLPLESADQNRIIGGEDAPDGFAPYMAALVYGEHLKMMTCGGSIISTWSILTAAHCIYYMLNKDGQLPPSYHAVVGSNKWNSDGMAIQFKDHNIHEGWDAELIKNDIAVLVTSTALVLNEKVTLIALSFAHIDGGEESFVAGWGVTGPRFDENTVHLAPTPDRIQLLFVKTLGPKECVHAMKDQQITAHPVDPECEICTFHSKGHGMCNGDSGSALVLEDTLEQIGIVSWGLPCARGLPDVFVRISAFKSFIEPYLL